MQLLWREAVGQGLRTRPIGDPHERVVGHGVADTCGGQLARQPVVAVAVELQAERCPGGDAQIDQAETAIHEIEIVMQALAAVRPDEGLVALLVVPGFIGIAGFHCRYHMHQPRRLAPLRQHTRDDVLLADMRLADVLDGNAGLSRQGRRGLSDALAQRLGEVRVIEDADSSGVEISRHPLGVAHRRQRSGDHQPVVTGKHPADPVGIALRQCLGHAASHRLDRGRLQQTYWFRLRRIRIEGTPTFVDVEGMPDRDFFYLIGIRHEAGGNIVEHSFWADTADDEGEIWQKTIRALREIENAQIVSYGAYETRFLRQMKERHPLLPEDKEFVEQLIGKSINLVQWIYRTVYFPTFSNSLKEVGRYLGFQWEWANASGAPLLLYCGEHGSLVLVTISDDN
jgi:hypothetical protein